MSIDNSCPTVLVVGADAATLGLVREWLVEAGLRVVDEPATPQQSDPGSRPLLVLVDVPFPRRGQSAPLQRVARQHAGTPVLALSPTFHSSVEPCGEVARSLGVAGVLPKPLRREALIAVVLQLSRPR